jgi:hypothetical protein
MSVPAAKSRIMHARIYLESRRYDEVEAVLDDAAELLVGLPETETAAVLSEIAALREAAAEAVMAEEIGVNVRRAERELRNARSDADAGINVPSGVAERIDRALGYLEGVPDAAKAVLLAEVAQLLARIGFNEPAPAPAMAPVAPVVLVAEPTDDQVRLLSMARTSIVGARANVESRRYDEVEGKLQEAVDLLVSVSDELKASLLADIEEIRAAAAEVDAAGKTRRVISELDRYFTRAEDGQISRSEASADAIAYLTKRLAADDVCGVLASDALSRYQTRLVEATRAHAAMIKAHALERAAPVLTELEEAVRTNPFFGRDQDAAYAMTSRLRALKDRVLGHLHPVPDDDPDVSAVKARIDVTDRLIEAAADAWALANVEANVVNRWRRIRDSIEGWESEVVSADVERVEAPSLPMTERAMRDTWFWLGDRDSVRIREEHAGNEVIEAAFRAAQGVYDGATAKLNRAFVHVLDEIDKLPSPAIEREREVLGHFESAVESVFEDTKYRDALLARIGQIKQRWEADHAAMLQARQELYDRLAVEADAAWPGIVAATGAGEDFDPADAAAPGKTVLLAGVYNRAGWEFNGFGFCTRFNGVPVGGSYEPHVLRALEHAWYELKLDVNDRIAWDVVGVVDGPGKLGERTEVILRDPDTNLVTGKVEQWLPVDCIRLRITALRAGPVAIGPQN